MQDSDRLGMSRAKLDSHGAEEVDAEGCEAVEEEEEQHQQVACTKRKRSSSSRLPARKRRKYGARTKPGPSCPSIAYQAIFEDHARPILP